MKSESQLNTEIFNERARERGFKTLREQFEEFGSIDEEKWDEMQVLMNKARQQGRDEMREELHKEGIDLCCSDCDKIKDAEQKGRDEERKKIIEMLENNHMGRQDILDQLKFQTLEEHEKDCSACKNWKNLLKSQDDEAK